MARIFRHLSQSKFISLAAKIGLTLAAFVLVARHIDLAQMGGMLRRQNHAMILGAAALLLSQTLLAALRWPLILTALAGGRRVFPFGKSFVICYIAAFFNCCLPGTVGADVVRVWLAKSDHVPLPMAIHSVIIDRLIALIALGLLVLAMLPQLAALAGFDVRPLLLGMAVAAPPAILALVYLHRRMDRYRHVRVIHWMMYFLDSLFMLFRHLWASVGSLAYGVVSHVAYCLGAYVLARSLGVEITAMQCVVLVPMVILAAILPVSIGGWGVREAGMVGMLKLAGVAHGQALLLSVQLGLVAVVVSLPGGMLWLMRRRSAAAARMESIA